MEMFICLRFSRYLFNFSIVCCFYIKQDFIPYRSVSFACSLGNTRRMIYTCVSVGMNACVISMTYHKAENKLKLSTKQNVNSVVSLGAPAHVFPRPKYHDFASHFNLVLSWLFLSLFLDLSWPCFFLELPNIALSRPFSSSTLLWETRSSENRTQVDIRRKVCYYRRRHRY